MRVAFLLTMLAATAVPTWGELVFPDAFWGEGRPAGEHLWVDTGGWARWEFQRVPPTGHQLSLDIMVWLRDPTPQELPVCLRVSTPSLDYWRSLYVSLLPWQRSGSAVLYRARVWFFRRELRLGSRLSLLLIPQLGGLAVSVSRTSAVLAIAEGGGGTTSVSGQGGGVVQSPPQARWLPETIGTRQRIYLSPGVYLGEVGAVVPGHYPDREDWLRVNLLPGQVLRVSLVSLHGECGLALYDPSGRPRVVMEPSSRLGLEYRATQRGAWQLRVRCTQPAGGARYRLEVAIDGGLP